MPYSRGVDAVLTFLKDVCEPYLRLFRRLLPAFGGFDFTPILAILVLYIARSLLVGLIKG
jgi:YggT family protein